MTIWEYECRLIGRRRALRNERLRGANEVIILGQLWGLKQSDARRVRATLAGDDEEVLRVEFAEIADLFEVSRERARVARELKKAG